MIGCVQCCARSDGGIAEKNGASAKRITFKKLGSKSGGSFLMGTRPRPITRREGVACGFAAHEVNV
jgi:hypothetical protein